MPNPTNPHNKETRIGIELAIRRDEQGRRWVRIAPYWHTTERVKALLTAGTALALFITSIHFLP